LALTLGSFGCVGKGAYQQKVSETEFLTRQVGEMEAEYQLLKDRKDYLVQRNGDLERRLEEVLGRDSAQQGDLAQARADIERLEKILSARSAETGATMKEMRETIDRLEQRNRELSRQVETEQLAREARVAQMKSTYDELVGMMDAEIKRGEVTISELQGKLSVNMVEKILFDSGAAEVKPAGLEVLRRVGGVVKEVADKEIRIEGYTDNVPISSRLQQKFPTNWELSAARAVNVLRFLQERVGLSGERLSACGFGEHRPVADNATPEGRALNRRIQIVLVPVEPATPPATTPQP
jgi:chemotaxis protein MotB